jgi:hypothetical protein
VKEFPFERKITMNISFKKLFLMAASVVIGAAVIQPATLPAQTSGDGFTRLLWRGTEFNELMQSDLSIVNEGN